MSAKMSPAHRFRALVLALPLILTLLLASCSPGIPQTGADLPGFAVQIADTEITAPATTSAGITTFTLNNTSQINRSVNVARLNTGVTIDQFISALSSADDLAALELVTLPGGRFAAAGETGEMVLDLKEGVHAIIAMPEDDTPPLVATFEVSGASATAAAPITADYNVELADFTFIMPERVQAGAGLWEITNTGAQWHEFLIVKPGEGFTREQFMEMMATDQPPSGPPPFENIASFGPITQGERGWMSIDLQPGAYWAICFLPDLAGDMTSHVEKGMFTEFTVE